MRTCSNVAHARTTTPSSNPTEPFRSKNNDNKTGRKRAETCDAEKQVQKKQLCTQPNPPSWKKSGHPNQVGSAGSVRKKINVQKTSKALPTPPTERN
jgi:hypothetical protein